MTSTTTKADIGAFITEITKVNGWFSPFYHAVNQVGGYNNITAELFQQHIDTIASQSTDIWITPFGNASKYHHERNVGTATLSAISEDATEWILNLTDNLDNAIFNQPLTILLNEPIFAIQTISQNSQNIPFTISAGILKFNAIPDGGNIILKKSLGSGINENMNYQTLTLCDHSQSYLLKVNNSKKSETKIVLYNSTGCLVKTLNDNLLDEGIHTFTIFKEQFLKGVYILQIVGTKCANYKLMIN